MFFYFFILQESGSYPNFLAKCDFTPESDDLLVITTRTVGVNKNVFVTLTHIRPYMPDEKKSTESIIDFCSFSFKWSKPIYGDDGTGKRLPILLIDTEGFGALDIDQIYCDFF